MLEDNSLPEVSVLNKTDFYYVFYFLYILEINIFTEDTSLASVYDQINNYIAYAMNIDNFIEKFNNYSKNIIV